MADPVLLARDGDVAIVTLNEPERRNALSIPMREALFDGLDQVMAGDARAVVLTGAGGNFCSGGDIKSFAAEAALVDVRDRLARLHRVVRLMLTGRKPIVAAVDGYAFGAGVSLALACDHVVAARDARFCASFNRVALMADLGLLYTLPLRVGMGKARELLMLGEIIEAPEALAIRLVDRLAEPGQALATAIERARLFAAAPPVALALTKAALARMPAPLDAVLQMEVDGQSALFQTDDHAEGRAAFLEKRNPIFKGR
jgi:2-(1,2-epoxy-1,2-dihydrophenyl)acetyl-CoA isomerase